MNIHENTYEPFRKPNDTPIYIHNESNHPPHVKKNVPIAVNKRLTTISSSKELFDQHKNEYQTALNKSKYSHTLTFEKKSNNNDIRDKQRLHSSCPLSRNINDEQWKYNKKKSEDKPTKIVKTKTNYKTQPSTSTNIPEPNILISQQNNLESAETNISNSLSLNVLFMQSPIEMQQDIMQYSDSPLICCHLLEIILA